jgi:hypothetical protein
MKLARWSETIIRDLAGKLAEASDGMWIDPDAYAQGLLRATRRCILCRKPSCAWGAYVPDKSADPVLRTGL